ncbi:MAG: sugar transferase [Clostridia bacterium]|nr:sugar transferase [Clostridia bacterium]
MKRLFDIHFSLCLGVITFPFLIIIGLLIRLDSHGKALYIQERVGKNGKIFRMLKFRTMVENAEQGVPVWADTDDPRCTRLGKKLREWRIDELPQLWNIFIGDMTLVGPRPERQCFYDQFETYIHGFSNRLSVTPGLTGLAQVNGGYDLLPEEKIVYDMEYISKRGFWLDFKIICRTAKVVCNKEGVK